MKTKKAGMGQSVGSEELKRIKGIADTIQDKKTVVDTLFQGSKAVREKNIAEMKKLFVQAPLVQSTRPSMVKEASSKTDEFFEKLASSRWDEAQTRFPELQKVAGGRGTSGGTVPAQANKRVSEGQVPSRPLNAGGQA